MIYQPTPEMRTCTKCHAWKPISEFCRDRSRKDGVHPWCRPCRSARGKSYYAQNRDPISEHRKQHRSEHRDEYRQRSKNYDDAHRDQKRERSKQNYRARRGIILRRQKQRRRTNPAIFQERIRQWKLANPEKTNAYQQRRLARRRNLPSNFTPAEWRRCLDYFGHCCAVCGKPAGLWSKIAIDHWIPISDPRPDNPGTVTLNIIPLCHAAKGGQGGCNNDKLNRDPIEWLYGTFDKARADAIMARVNTYFEWVRQQDSHQ